AGSLAFSFSTITTITSDPTKNARWFGRNVNPNFLHASAFIGDYSNIAPLPGGGVVAYWTDMRNEATFAGITRQGEDAFFASVS
ncbi:MAG TPA: hypothetical protein VNF91_05550, partial [Candidatus Acidoferrum sp.]|nr:hypothetical protein [Candidatus Acidoferrum sp.]